MEAQATATLSEEMTNSSGRDSSLGRVGLGRGPRRVIAFHSFLDCITFQGETQSNMELADPVHAFRSDSS
nr:hypothetical protein Hi04_10k_c5966_00003 [uncultured bacterium]